MKKLFKIFAGILSFVFLSTMAFASIGGGGISGPILWRKSTGNTVLLQNANWELGSASSRIAKIYSTAIDTNTIVINTSATTPFTLGSVVFAGASGVLTEDNANFFWDDSNDRIGFGEQAPATVIEITDANPYVTLHNSTNEDTEGGRESQMLFKGQQSGAEETTLAKIQASHDGTSDDQKGDLIFYTNDGADGDAPTEQLRIDSAGLVTTTGDVTVTGGDVNIGTAASAPGNLNLHDAGIITMYDDGNNTNVVVGPVTDGTTTLGVTGSLDVSATVDAVTLTDGTLSINAGAITSGTTAVFGSASSLTLGTASSAAGGIIMHNASNANTVTIQSGATATTYAMTLPTAVAGAGEVLTDAAGNGTLSWTTPTVGDVTAAAAITDHTIVRGDGGAKGVQDSGVTIDDSDNVTGIASLTASTLTDGTASLTSGALSSVTTIGMGGDLTNYEAVNDANPEIRLGSADANELHMQTVYDSGAQTLDYVLIGTDSAGEGDIAISPASGFVGIGMTTPASIIDFAAASHTIGATIGANTLTLGGATSTIDIPGLLNAGGLNIDGDVNSGDINLYDAQNDANPALNIGSTSANQGTIQSVFDSVAQTLDYLLIDTTSAGEGDIALTPASTFVGINKTAPTVALDVTGAITSSTTITADTAFSGTSLTNAAAITVSSTGAGVNVTTHTDATDDFTVNTSALVVEGDTGNVGIGTNAPAALLSLGLTGTTTGVMNFAGSTSGLITLQAAAAAGTYTMTWPTAVAGAGEVLTDAAGDGVLSWAAAGGGGLSWGDTITSTTGIGITETVANSSDAGTTGHKIIVGDTQTNATNGLHIDLGTSAAGHSGLWVDAKNASSSVTGLYIDQGTTGTGRAIRVEALSINSNESMLHLNAAAAAGTYSNRSWHYAYIKSRRRSSRASGTTADDFDTFHVEREDKQEAGGGTLTAAGSVGYFQHIAAEDAGTLTDTVNVIELIQDADSTGNIISATNGTNTVLIDYEGGLVPAQITGDPCATMAVGAIFYNATSNYHCFCNGANADIKMNDNSTACF